MARGLIHPKILSLTILLTIRIHYFVSSFDRGKGSPCMFLGKLGSRNPYAISCKICRAFSSYVLRSPPSIRRLGIPSLPRSFPFPSSSLVSNSCHRSCRRSQLEVSLLVLSIFLDFGASWIWDGKGLLGRCKGVVPWSSAELSFLPISKRVCLFVRDSAKMREDCRI